MKIKNKSFKDKNKKWLKRHVDDEFVKKSIGIVVTQTSLGSIIKDEN